MSTYVEALAFPSSEALVLVARLHSLLDLGITLPADALVQPTAL